MLALIVDVLAVLSTLCRLRRASHCQSSLAVPTAVVIAIVTKAAPAQQE
jgi:hypothetical protein